MSLIVHHKRRRSAGGVSSYKLATVLGAGRGEGRRGNLKVLLEEQVSQVYSC